MDDAEIATWSAWASPATVVSVDALTRAVRDDWRRRILRDPEEMLALMPWCPGGLIVSELAARAAAQAAAELAVVWHIWPRPLDDVLRPYLRWAG